MIKLCFVCVSVLRVGLSGSSRKTAWPSCMKGDVCNLELRCVKMRRIGSRVNVYTNVSRPLRSARLNRLKVDVARRSPRRSMGEEELVLLVQRDSGA